MLSCKIWLLWPVLSLIEWEGNKIFFNSPSLVRLSFFFTAVPIHDWLIFFNDFRSVDAFGVRRSKVKPPPKTKHTTSDTSRCNLKKIDILESVFAWWEIKSKLLSARCSYRGAIVQVRLAVWYWGGGGGAVCCLFVAIWNKSHFDMPESRNSLLLLWNLKHQRQHHLHQPPPLLLRPGRWPLWCLS